MQQIGRALLLIEEGVVDGEHTGVRSAPRSTAGRKERTWPTTLSGGEAQRVALARALSNEPQLLLADEPFAALDALTRLKMHALVDALRTKHDPAIVLVTHDVDEAVRLADRVVLLRDGVVAIDELVSVPHPRSADDPGLAALRERLLSALGVEVRPTASR